MPVIDNYIRIGAHHPGWDLYDSDSGRAPLLALQDALGFKFDGQRKFVLVNPNQSLTNPTYVSDKTKLTEFFNDPDGLGKVVYTNFETQGSSAQILSGAFDAIVIDYVQHIMSFKALNPTWTAEMIMTNGHEGNLSSNYLWVPSHPTNLANAGGNMDIAIQNWRLACRKISNLIRRNSCVNASGVPIPAGSVPVDSDGVPIYSDNVRPFIFVAHELSANNIDGGQRDILEYTPGAKYFDMIAWNPYNRYYTLSGNAQWRQFEQFAKNALLHVSQVMAPGKPIIIGEMATMSAGRVTDQYSSSFTNLVGGSGFPTNQVNQPVPDAAIDCDGIKPPILYNSNAQGQITSLVAPNGGEEMTYCKIASSWLGGSGFSVNVRVRGGQLSKPDWYRKALRFLKTVPNLKYIFFYWENKVNTLSPTNRQDVRDWAPNSPATKRLLNKELNIFNTRTFIPQTHYVHNRNYCPDPRTRKLSVWESVGSNAGNVSIITDPAHLPPDTEMITSVLRITHNGIQGDHNTNRVRFFVPKDLNWTRNEQKMTISFLAKANPTTEAGINATVRAVDPLNPTRMYIRAGVSPEDSDPDDDEDESETFFSTRMPPLELETYYQEFESYADIQLNKGWYGEFQVGRNTIPLNIHICAVKFEIGDRKTPLDFSVSEVTLDHIF